MSAPNEGERLSINSSPSINSSKEEPKEEEVPVQDFVGQNVEAHRTRSRAEENYPNLDEDFGYEADIALSRKASRLTTDYDNLIRQATNTSRPLPPMGGGRPYPRELGSRDPFVVQFDGEDDPEHPKNWRLRTKLFYTTTVGLSAFCVSIGSALFAEASQDLMQVFHIGWTVATLGTSLFVFGFAAGPVIYGPLSELFGRKMILI
ncbi:Major facilitator superfamily multidrug transporter FLU1, partial [Candida parapsilosis]